MADEKKYIIIMIESLRKKESLLDTLLVKNEAQAACIMGKEYGDIKWDSFQVLMAEKDTAIDRINELDDGFEALYVRVKDVLQGNKQAYAEEIRTMQELIKRITDKGMAIRAGEEANRRSIERILGSAKQEIRQSKASVKVASDYYKTMSKMTTAEPRFLDQKK
ncbi:MAG: flagellar protein FliT [Lachnospiraceae bacterium]